MTMLVFAIWVQYLMHFWQRGVTYGFERINNRVKDITAQKALVTFIWPFFLAFHGRVIKNSRLGHQSFIIHDTHRVLCICGSYFCFCLICNTGNTENQASLHALPKQLKCPNLWMSEITSMIFACMTSSIIFTLNQASHECMHEFLYSQHEACFMVCYGQVDIFYCKSCKIMLQNPVKFQGVSQSMTHDGNAFSLGWEWVTVCSNWWALKTDAIE